MAGTQAHAGLVERLAKIAACDRSNAAQIETGRAAEGMRQRASTIEEAIAALDGSASTPTPASTVSSPPDDVSLARHMDDELGQDDAAASRAAPTRA